MIRTPGSEWLKADNRPRARRIRPTCRGSATSSPARRSPAHCREGQNAPQTPPLGLYTEQLSGTPFTAPRAENRRSWLYRIRPSAMHRPFRRIDDGLMRTAPCHEAEPSPNRLRWDPLPFPDAPGRFRRGPGRRSAPTAMPARAHGIGVHVYRATRSMTDRVFYDADGELLIVPQQGRLLLHTEFGVIDAAPGEIAVIPRGVKFRVELPDGRAAGYVCENYGALFRLPELGPIGANGLANPRDFLTPVRRLRGRARRPASWSPSSRGICGRPSWTIRRSTSSPGTAITRRTNTISRGSTRSARSASTIPTRRSSRC